MTDRKNKNWSLLANAVVVALPGDIRKRQALLTALLEELPRKHPLEAQIRTLQFGLNDHLVRQMEFPLSSEAPETTQGGK